MKKIISLSLLLTISACLSFSNAGVGPAIKTAGSVTVSGLSAANNYLTPWGRGLATYKHFENCIKNFYYSFWAKDIYIGLGCVIKSSELRKNYLRQARRELVSGTLGAAATLALTYAYVKAGQKFLPSVPYASSLANTKYGSYIPYFSELFTNKVESIAKLMADKTGLFSSKTEINPPAPSQPASNEPKTQTNPLYKEDKNTIRIGCESKEECINLGKNILETANFNLLPERSADFIKSIAEKLASGEVEDEEFIYLIS